MTKRSGTQSGEDRDAAAQKRLREGTTSPRSDDSFTPVRHVLDIIDESHPELGPAIKAVWAHVANVEMRANARMGDETAFESMRDELAEIREDSARRFADLTGRDGTNGKVGTIRQSLEKLHSRIWWGVTALVGSIGSVAVKLVIVGQTYGAMKAQIEADHAEIQLLQTMIIKQAFRTPEKVQ